MSKVQNSLVTTAEYDKDVRKIYRECLAKERGIEVLTPETAEADKRAEDFAVMVLGIIF